MEMPRKPSWWTRNWIWFVPVTIVGSFVVCAGCCTGLIFLAFNTIKQMQPYKDAVAAVQGDAQVQTLLGTPLEPSWWVAGEIDESTSGGTANFTFSITGPKGTGWVESKAQKGSSGWVTTALTVRDDASGQTIDVVPAADAAPTSQPAEDAPADEDDGSP
jgi:hypothetical protein